MSKFKVETAVGIFLVAGFLCFVYLAFRLGDVNLFRGNEYLVKARFSSVSGLKEGSRVEMAGVLIGKVKRIRLNGFQAEVDMTLDPGVKLQEDAIASIRTQGIIGDKFVKISPGASDEIIASGGEIIETEGAISLEDLVSKYIFEKE